MRKSFFFASDAKAHSLDLKSHENARKKARENPVMLACDATNRGDFKIERCEMPAIRRPRCQIASDSGRAMRTTKSFTVTVPCSFSRMQLQNLISLRELQELPKGPFRTALESVVPKGPSRTKNTTESEFRYGEKIRYGRSKTLRRGLRNACFRGKRDRKTVQKVKNYGSGKILRILEPYYF